VCRNHEESQGDDPALDPTTWLDEHGDYLFNFAMGQVRSEHVAEEIVQETLVAAIGARSSFRGDSTVRTWLTGILRNKVTDHIRRRSRDRRMFEDDEMRHQVSRFFNQNGYWRIAISRRHHAPDSPGERSEFWRIFRECAKKISPNLADAFALRELNGLETAEICDILGVSPTNLRTMLYRARLLLRKCLEKNWFESGEPARLPKTETAAPPVVPSEHERRSDGAENAS